MKCGKPISTFEEEDVVNGVLKSLRVAHSVEWCHTDIRMNNVMRFGEHVQLIDYGFACRVHDSFSFGEGDRYDSRGARLRNCKIGDECKWQICDDYEMLYKSLLLERRRRDGNGGK